MLRFFLFDLVFFGVISIGLCWVLLVSETYEEEELLLLPLPENVRKYFIVSIVGLCCTYCLLYTHFQGSIENL